jgi:hypothetical protein
MSDVRSDVSEINEVGTCVMVVSAIAAGLLLWGVLPIRVPIPLTLALAIVGGAVGGAMNLYGRGSIALGALIGAICSLGGFGAVYLWLNYRFKPHWFELTLAFLIGIAPGGWLQYLFARKLTVK